MFTLLAAFGGICKHTLVLDKEAVKSGFSARLLTRGECVPDESQASRCRRRRVRLLSYKSKNVSAVILSQFIETWTKPSCVNERNDADKQTDKLNYFCEEGKEDIV